MTISFVTVDAFAPDADPWVPVGPIASVSREDGDFVLALQDDAALAVRLSVISASCLRVRFDPRPGGDPSVETSPAVIDRALGSVEVRVQADADPRSDPAEIRGIRAAGRIHQQARAGQDALQVRLQDAAIGAAARAEVVAIDDQELNSRRHRLRGVARPDPPNLPERVSGPRSAPSRPASGS